MLDRRTFMGLSAAAGATALTVSQGKASADSHGGGREVYELRRYTFESEDQVNGFDAFVDEAANSALNRAGVSPVGAFLDPENPLLRYVLFPHANVESVIALVPKMLADEALGSDGADFINAPASSPAYTRAESSLLLAFEGMPKLERPTDVPGRVFQLRIYESPSVTTGQKKIEMFNVGEIDIFRKTGLNPVFFGEAVIGEKMPNLTYMLGFDSMDEQKAAWKTFIADPDWKAISSKPEYADDRILSNITNINLKPTPYSQI